MEVEGNNIRRRRLQTDGQDEEPGRTTGTVHGNDKKIDSPVQLSRTLLDVIRDEEPNASAYKNLIKHHNSKKNWNAFKDRLRSCRGGAGDRSTLMSSIDPPTTNPVATQNNRPLLTRRTSTRLSMEIKPNHADSDDDSSEEMVCDISTRICSPLITRRSSDRDPSSTGEVETDHQVADLPVQNNRSQMLLRMNSSRLTQSDPFNEHESATVPNARLSAALAAEREQIQRVVSSSSLEYTEDSDPENEAPVDPIEEQQQPVRMSLMDLLEETDRQMGWVSYTAAVEEEEDENDDETDGGNCGGVVYNCSLCNVRHKGSAFVLCGHTYCKLCTKELWVSKDNCPLCNGFILEILDIF